MLAGCGAIGGGFTCDEDHAAVAQVRQLPSQTLSALFAEAEAWARDPQFRRRRYTKHIDTPLPGIAGSEHQFKAFASDVVRVPLEGCFDHGITLWLEGLNRADGAVVLRCGEGPTGSEQTLWRKPSPSTR